MSYKKIKYYIFTGLIDQYVTLTKIEAVVEAFSGKDNGYQAPEEVAYRAALY